MSIELNQHWKLARRPTEGLPTNGDFAWGESEVPTPAKNHAFRQRLGS